MNLSLSTRWKRRLFWVGILAIAFSLGSAAQEQLGISFSVDGLHNFRAWVQSLGWLGPLVFVLLVVIRLFIGLSSHLILILGGLVFGLAGGMIWGTLGLIVSALMLFLVASQLSGDWVQRRFGDQFKNVEKRIQRVGAMAVFAITAHPVGLLTPAHVAAGIAGLKLGEFSLAVVLASPIRTAPYVFLGTAVLDLTTQQSLMVAAGIFLVFLLPLLHPRIRGWIVGGNEPRESKDEKDANDAEDAKVQ